MRADRRGLTLLEVLVALTILGVAAAAWTALATQAGAAVNHARALESRIMDASRALTVASLWPAEHLTLGGSEMVGGVRIRIVPIQQSLFEVSALDSASGAELLRTTIYARGQSDSR